MGLEDTITKNGVTIIVVPTARIPDTLANLKITLKGKKITIKSLKKGRMNKLKFSHSINNLIFQIRASGFRVALLIAKEDLDKNLKADLSLLADEIREIR